MRITAAGDYVIAMLYPPQVEGENHDQGMNKNQWKKLVIRKLSHREYF